MVLVWKRSPGPRGEPWAPAARLARQGALVSGCAVRAGPAAAGRGIPRRGPVCPRLRQTRVFLA